jgi:BirA family transcriptional regulator, biotin operon repressor / biotin---[acetyl-CoA-carboxylase] ligase
MIIGSKLFFYKNLPSTNSFAADLLRQGTPPEGSIIHTNYQSAGRGQTGNRWESGDNKNLLISIVLYPKIIKPSDQFLISMAISTGISDFLKRYIQGVTIKWPNDIYVINDKIAGILIENSIMGDTITHTIAGIGINVNQTEFPDLPNPVSLCLLTGTVYDLSLLLKELASDLDKRYNQLISGDYSNIRREYISLLYRLNEWSRYRDASGPFTGRISDLSFSGRLLIERSNGTISEYSYKEVDFIV